MTAALCSHGVFELAPLAMLRNLHITDLTPASGETYYNNRQWCVEQGAQMHYEPVSLFDYKHMMRKNPDAPAPLSFDLIVCFGLCLNVFASAEQLSTGTKNSTVARQYRFLARSESSLASHQQLFTEALLGQDVNSTQILIHQINHAIVSPVPVSYCFAKIRLFNPEARRVGMFMGSQMSASTSPLVCNVSGPGTIDALSHVRSTASCEQQLDVQSAILATLRAGGSVLVLGAGDLRFIRTLQHAAVLDIGRPIRQPSFVGAFGKKGFGGYFDYVLTQPLGTAQPDESTVGRVNLKRVRRWCDNLNSTYSQ